MNGIRLWLWWRYILLHLYGMVTCNLYMVDNTVFMFFVFLSLFYCTDLTQTPQAAEPKNWSMPYYLSQEKYLIPCAFHGSTDLSLTRTLLHLFGTYYSLIKNDEATFFFIEMVWHHNFSKPGSSSPFLFMYILLTNW